MSVTAPENLDSSLRLDITGMHCASCVSRIERFLTKSPGVNSASVNLATNTASVTYNPLIASRETVVDAVVKSGYGASVSASAGSTSTIKKEKSHDLVELTLAIILTCPIVFLSMVMHIDRAPGAWLIAAATAIVVFYCGRNIYGGALTALMHGGSATMDTLIAVGSFSAFAFSLYQLFAGNTQQLYFETAAVIITLILIGRKMEGGARRTAADSLANLSKLVPQTASRVAGDGSESIVPLGDLLPGDVIRIRPGEKLAADGIVVDGASAVDESLVTGESIPVEKTAGSKVIGGTLNSGGSFLYRITAVGTDTIVAAIVGQVQDAQGSKAPIQRVADKVSSVFVPTVFVAAALTFVIRLLLIHDSVSASLLPSVAVLVIACPCALGLATPTAIMVSSGRGASLGVLIKNGTVLEQSEAIKTIIFDKTGTLTEGKIVVTDVIETDTLNKDQILQFAASAEVGSEHPLAKAIVDGAKDSSEPMLTVSHFESHWGKGVSADVSGRKVVIGNAALLTSAGAYITDQTFKLMDNVSSSGKTAIFVAVDSAVVGVIAFADTVRPEAKSVVDRIKKLGIHPAILTGDEPGPAAAIARIVGIDDYSAGLLPEDKGSAIKRWVNSKTGVVAMVGDGVNDAPALAAADVGIAMGSASDITTSASDISLIRGSLASILTAIDLSKKTMQIIRQNLFWAFIFNAIGIPLAAMGFLNPMIAAFAMAFSSFFVVSNSLRLKTIHLSNFSIGE